VVLLAIYCVAWPAGASASTNVDQVALPGDCIPKFAVSLPVFGPAGPIPRVDGEAHPALTVSMKEINQSVLPQGMFDLCGLGITFGPTRVWAYETTDSFTGKLLGPANWPGVTVEVVRREPTLMKYWNRLPTFDPLNKTGPGLVQGLLSGDKTIDYADPMNPSMMNNVCLNNPAAVGCASPFIGPPPTSVHLHGGEVSSFVDGGPMAWFAPNGAKGPDYFSVYNAGAGKAVFIYPNRQEPGTLWFHDHSMGLTRTNVYSGMAAFYLLRDKDKEPINLPRGAYEIEMAIQDRQFDTNSQLFFPDGTGLGAVTGAACGSGLPGDPCLNGLPGNPSTHPFWIPEFIGDVVTVNGAPWPYLNVQPRRYRFRILDGSNARFYNLKFGPAKVYAIGSDGNILNSPKLITSLLMAPGERYDLIVDFTGLNGQTITVTNDARMPFPMGLSPVDYVDPACVPGPCPADQPGMASVMQFNVSPVTVSDTSCNPAVVVPAGQLGQCARAVPIPKFTDGLGGLAPNVKIDKKRQLVLKEHSDPISGAPLEVLVNNTAFNGLESAGVAADFPIDGVSEAPQQGSTELWEIINLTADAHPMHLHLTQFQVVGRQSFNTDPLVGPGDYVANWGAAFGTDLRPLSPGCTVGQYCPGFGPPFSYSTANADGALGGNPALGGLVTAGGYLLDDNVGPRPEESGWKDTAKAWPGQVLRILVRYTPSSAPVVANTSYVGQNLYAFDPKKGNGYVWHCHIIDHEDNDMMRPIRVKP
jgi:FtsP/CotA-like multicopper oxidase with cupredoxin domain